MRTLSSLVVAAVGIAVAVAIDSSSYPANYVHDITLQNEKLTRDNLQLKEQMAKLDHHKSCLDARSYHRTLVDATATSKIRDLNETSKHLASELQHEWTRNNHLREQNYNLTVSTNALQNKNRELTSENSVLSTENIRCRTNAAALTSTVDPLQQHVQALYQKNNELELKASGSEQENRDLRVSFRVEQQAHRALRDQHEFLQQTSNEYEVNNVDLTRKNEQLDLNNMQLNTTNAKVQALVALLEPQVPGLTTKNIELMKRNKTVSEKNYFLEKRGNELELAVRDLRKEIARMNDWVLRLQRASREEPFSQQYQVPIPKE